MRDIDFYLFEVRGYSKCTVTLVVYGRLIDDLSETVIMNTSQHLIRLPPTWGGETPTLSKRLRFRLGLVENDSYSPSHLVSC
jgi:hypothetical protein